MKTIREMQAAGLPAPEIRPDYTLNELVAVAADEAGILEGDTIEVVPSPAFFPRSDVVWKFLVSYLLDVIEEPMPGGGLRRMRPLRGVVQITSGISDPASQSAALYQNAHIYK